MALECAHCGARADEGTTRCPQCLRSTGLVQIPAQPTRRPRRGALLVGVAVSLATALTAGGVLALRAQRHRGSDALLTRLRSVSGADLAPVLEVGAECAPLVTLVRGAGDDLARARAVMDAVSREMSASGARRALTSDEAPPARSPDAIYRALRTREGRVTDLDLARLEAAVLRASGTRATVAERGAAPREDEPADPSGVFGSYVVLVGDYAVDVASAELVPARDTRPRPLDERALRGAMLAQSALAEAALGGRRDRALSLADAAVEAWPEGAVPLATRAVVTLAVGSSSGLALAERDLSAAIALRDEAPLHLMRARLLLTHPGLGAGSVETEVNAAFRRARAWGPAALALVALGTQGPDAGDPCAPLGPPREEWTDDALVICRRASQPEEQVRAAALRLMASSRDPLRVAYAALGGAPGASARVSAQEREELARWLLILGRADLAAEVLGRPDAGP